MADKIRIAIAEDFQLLCDDLCEFINQQSDMTVVGTAHSKQEILRLSDQAECDIILMDIEMETLHSGIEAAEIIRDKKRDQKIIYLTAHDTEEMILTAMGTGAVDYVVKGQDYEEILRHIRAAYRGEPIMEVNIQQKVIKEYSRLRRSERSLLFFINSIAQLTPAERQLIQLLLKGKSASEIAEIRCVELVTVKTQIKSLLRKFQCRRTKEIVTLINELNIGYLF
ncbi:response regulator transcription factor [Caproiciproducens sp. NJN-50]|uniref:response regulator n=1 Tax=Caproiciproducens sp. NJN-50 TaxID=2507162 RepID=UPI000FFE2515|nr:response regulator transcription factor [Caproiciproducens sp. NJN-50]QAT50963.1 response regulator transcription factor [Caproiciproducens sp. NJN-50]